MNYEPNSSSSSPQEDPAYRDTQVPLHGHVTREKIEKTDDYTQAGELFRSFTAEEQNNLIDNLINDLKGVPAQTQMRALCHFFQADGQLGGRLARGLGVDISAYMPSGRP